MIQFVFLVCPVRDLRFLYSLGLPVAVFDAVDVGFVCVACLGLLAVSFLVGLPSLLFVSQRVWFVFFYVFRRFFFSPSSATS